MRWLDQLAWTGKNTPASKVFYIVFAVASSGRGRPKFRWKNQVESHLYSLGISKGRHTSKGRKKWCAVVKSTIIAEVVASIEEEFLKLVSPYLFAAL